jgi:predicted transcriptional regulator of viral defense system
MQLIKALEKLQNLNEAVFQTTDAAAQLAISTEHASQLLSRLIKGGQLVRLKKGLWAFPNKIEAIQLPQYLVAPLPAYLSLQTALYFHGMIDQIPEVVYAVSLARTQQFKTPLGAVSIHHLSLDFFFGYELHEKSGVFLATPEKALVDILYLSPVKSGLFQSLPELEFPTKFSFKRAYDYVKKIPFQKRRQLVMKRLDQLSKG